MPLFVKEGSIIPAGPEIQYATEKKANPITLYLFTGKDAHFELYEDEDVNYNYENGKYAMIAFDYNEKTKTLIIGDRRGSFDGMPMSRTFQIVVVDKHHPQGIELSTSKLYKELKYDGKKLSIVVNQ
ncbi:MAG: DUF5110 domain-containing protein [Cyclobacteriaceae bacterium]